ncbi:15637_t:CDS:2, partial [Acaulospora morrowiae]
MKINEKSTSVIVTANGTRERTLGKVKEIGIMVQGVTISATLRIIESRDETLLLGTDWFQRGNARIHFDEWKILLRYRGKELEVLISHNGIEGLAWPDELKVSDDESKDTFDELEYESENVEKEERYYTGEQSEEEETMDKGIPSPAVYLTILEEIPTLEDDEKYEDEKPREKRESSVTSGEAGSRDEESDLPGPQNENLILQNDAKGATNLDSLNTH